MRLRFEPLGTHHDRAAFFCGHDEIDRFLKTVASQRQKRLAATTFVAVNADGDRNQIVGFYTIIPHEFRGTELPDPFRRGAKVGALSAVPGALLAQLAVAADFQDQGVGKALIRHAFTRIASLAKDFGCAAVVTDPIDERARDFYAGFDFVALPAEPENSNTDSKKSKKLPRMIVTVTTILAAFSVQRVAR